jgi:predicted small lipoprotein YifL
MPWNLASSWPFYRQILSTEPRMKSKLHPGWIVAAALASSLGLAACEKKGPVEQAGEEVEEAIDTLKNGGEESTATQIDDALDETREAAEDAADELKKE